MKLSDNALQIPVMHGDAALNAVADAAESLAASFEQLRSAFAARLTSLAEMAAALADVRAVLAQQDQAVHVHAEQPKRPAEAVGEVLSAWLAAGNAGRALSAADLHKECLAVAAQRGLGVDCLGDARSFGLRLSKYAKKLPEQLVLHKHAARGGKSAWSLCEAGRRVKH